MNMRFELKGVVKDIIVTLNYYYGSGSFSHPEVCRPHQSFSVVRWLRMGG